MTCGGNGRNRAGRGAARRAPLRGWLAARWPSIRFLLRFFLGCAGGFSLTGSDWFDAHLRASWLAADAACSTALLRALGQTAACEGTTIRLGDRCVQVRRGCDAGDAVVLYVAAVLAMPAGARARGWGLGVGLVVLWGLNLLRIGSLCLARHHWPGGFEWLHLELWPVILSLAAVVLWLAWVAALAPQPAPHG